MKTRYILLLFAFFFIIGTAFSQKKIHGKVNMVSVKNGKDVVEPIINANVFWAGTTSGTVTDSEGNFVISRPSGKTKLVASFIGTKSDTLELDSDAFVTFILKDNAVLDEIVVNERLGGSYISKLNAIQTSTITSAGLQKLACCNLSESFQNNATVDVGYSDAVSGAKQIQMLGLAGIYSQIMTENIPSIRGMASAYGLGFIPGPWMESIQISKGTSSVKNGYESITGQINVELKKPTTSEPLFVNLYGSNEGRMEANIATALKLNDKVSTSLLLHGSTLQTKIDHNHDGFLDMPMSELVNVVNRWMFSGENYHSILVMNYIDENRKGGQNAFYDNENQSGSSLYGTQIGTKRFQFFSKNGFMFEKPETSLGIQISGTYHEQSSNFGTSIYDGNQQSVYVNAIYETILGTTNHKLSTGLSYMYDNYQEKYSVNTYVRDKSESTPGAFIQYTYSILDIFNLILGFRADRHNEEYFYTPRIHLRYDIGKGYIFRASAGKGYRTANIFSENIGMLSSSRNIIIANDLKTEQAWNYGTNFTKEFDLGKKKKATISIDFYRTEFQNQIVVDLDKNVHEINFANLDGKSYSNSFQTEFTIEPIKHLEITAAYRYIDAKTTYHNELLERPYVSKYKGLLSVSYATRFEKWKFDFTAQLNGKSRLPNTSGNPVEFQREAYAPEYYLLYFQITRKFKHFDVYAGSENLTDYTQMHPIVDAANPFGPNFDASMIWGPISGRMFYAGIRLTIK